LYSIGFTNRSLRDISIIGRSTPSHRRAQLGLVDKAFLLLYPEFHKKNFEFIIKILLEKDYPLDFIFNITISVRIKDLINNKIMKQKKNNNVIFMFTAHDLHFSDD